MLSHTQAPVESHEPCVPQELGKHSGDGVEKYAESLVSLGSADAKAREVSGTLSVPSVAEEVDGSKVSTTPEVDTSVEKSFKSTSNEVPPGTVVTGALPSTEVAVSPAPYVVDSFVITQLSALLEGGGVPISTLDSGPVVSSDSEFVVGDDVSSAAEDEASVPVLAPGSIV